MNNKKIEREIVKALQINTKINWNLNDPNKEFKDLISFVKKLFKED